MRAHSAVYTLISPAGHLRQGQRKTGSAVARAGLVGRAMKQTGVDRVESGCTKKFVLVFFKKKKKKLPQANDSSSYRCKETIIQHVQVGPEGVTVLCEMGLT